MPGKKVKQKRKVKSIEVKCNVSENILAEIAKLAPSSFFVSFGSVCKKSELNDAIISSGQQYVTSLTSNEEYDIVLKTDINFFNEIVPLLFINEAEDTEVIVIYIPFDTITFAQFLYNWDSGVQGSAVKKELCCLMCTWVTEDNSLFFQFDNFQGAEIFEEIKKLI